MIKYFDCSCEDYPCCGHYDISYGDEEMAYYCDTCGITHSGDCLYDDDEDEDTDDEDVLAQRPQVRVNAVGQRLRPGAPELPGDHWLEESYDDRFEEAEY